MKNPSLKEYNEAKVLLDIWKNKTFESNTPLAEKLEYAASVITNYILLHPEIEKEPHINVTRQEMRAAMKEAEEIRSLGFSPKTQAAAKEEAASKIIEKYRKENPHFSNEVFKKIGEEWYAPRDLVGKRIIIEREGYSYGKDKALPEYTESTVLEVSPNGKAIHTDTRHTNPPIVLRWAGLDELKIVAVLEKKPDIERLKQEAFEFNSRPKDNGFGFFGR